MKASIEWLKDYSDIDIDSVKLGDILTMTGSKVETIEQKGNDIKNVVVGKILEIKKHEDSDHLVVTQVDLGNEKVQIVTGADNIKVGDIVPIAKDGSELPGDIKIKKGMLRGVESCGMMCSVGELGLDINDYPGQIEHGIMILDKKLEKEIKQEKEDIIFKFNLDKQDISKELEININIEEKDKIEKELEYSNKKIVEYKLELNGLKYEENEVNDKLEDSISKEEEYENLQEQLDELEEKNKYILATKELLEKAYEKMKNNVTPKFTQNLSNIASNISNGKYKKVIFDEEKGLVVELETGEYISANRLSIGTIDELYLSLRLSMLDEISSEKMPIILDEAFAYFDDERLKNCLIFLAEQSEKHQIIILTCSNRERQILDSVNIKYNLVEL